LSALSLDDPRVEMTTTPAINGRKARTRHDQPLGGDGVAPGSELPQRTCPLQLPRTGKAIMAAEARPHRGSALPPRLTAGTRG
jgi:hypothetical protein